MIISHRVIETMPCAISILCNPKISIQDINHSVILTEELSNPGCLINLLFTSNREPLTQHLWKAIYFSKLKQQKKKQSSTLKIKRKKQKQFYLTIYDSLLVHTLHKAVFDSKCCAFCLKKKKIIELTL